MAFGQIIDDFEAPVSSNYGGRAVAFAFVDDQSQYLYLTTYPNKEIYKVTTSGDLEATIFTDLTYGALYYDSIEEVFWAGGYENTFVIHKVGLDGSVLDVIDYSTIPEMAALLASETWGGYVDGITLVGDDIFFSTAWGINVYKITKNGTYIGSFPVPLTADDSTGLNTGIAYDGQYLWLAIKKAPYNSNFPIEIVKTDINGTPIDRFSTDYPDIIDLAFDPITFAPTCVLWSNEQGNPHYIRAWEITCPQPAYRGILL